MLYVVASDEISEIILISYDYKCPDCGDDIPENVCDGEECCNCGHVFNLPRDND